MLTIRKTNLACGIVIVALVVSQGYAATLYVDLNDPTAFKSIQKAIDAAKNFDEIVVYPGIYKENIDFKGKAITVTSRYWNIWAERTIVDGNNTGPAVLFRYGETEHSVLRGLTIQNGTDGVLCQNDAHPKIHACVITSNSGAGVMGGSPTVVECTITANEGEGIEGHSVSVLNCVVSGNKGPGLVLAGDTVVTNCTIIGNDGSGVELPYLGGTTAITVSNSIIAYNAGWGLLHGSDFGSMTLTSKYNDIYSNLAGAYSTRVQHTYDIQEPPYFVDNGVWDADGIWHQGDYHLMSTVGRLDPVAKAWVKDPIDSPCLDKGDPNTQFLDEPYPNGGRVNLGAYGGTPEASMSIGGVHCTEYPAMDFNHDCKVDQADLDLFMQHWLDCGLDDPNACWPDGTPAAPQVQP